MAFEPPPFFPKSLRWKSLLQEGNLSVLTLAPSELGVAGRKAPSGGLLAGSIPAPQFLGCLARICLSGVHPSLSDLQIACFL